MSASERLNILATVVTLVGWLTNIVLTVSRLRDLKPNLGVWMLVFLSHVATWMRVPHLWLNTSGVSSESVVMYITFLGFAVIEGISLAIQTYVQQWPATAIALACASLISVVVIALALRRKLQVVAKMAKP